MGIGEQWELSVLLKIKEVVDLVGHLPPLKSLNLTSKSTLNKQLRNFLLSISLLVHQMNFNVVETVVARDLFHNWDSLILNSLDWYQKQTIHTLLETLDKLEPVTIAQMLWTLSHLFEDTKPSPEMIMP